jgi:gliding motility-associated-like protein
VTNSCGVKRDTCTISINNQLSALNIGRDTTICTGNSIVLNALNPDYSSYLWQNGTTGTSLTASASGVYWVEVSNQCGSRRDSVTITVQTLAPVYLGNDTTICSGSTYVLNAGSGYTSYTWQNGSTAQTFNATSAGIYYVTATNSCGSFRDTIRVTSVPAVVVNLGPDQNICNGSSIMLSAGACGSCTYTWQDSSTAMTYNVSAGGLYYVSGSNACNTDSDSILISIQNPVPVNLGNDTSVCPGSSFTLNAGTGYNSYLWQNGSSAATFTVNAAGMYAVTATNACGAFADTINVLSNPSAVADLGADQFICNGSTTVLNSTGCNLCNYVWQDGSTASTFSASSSGIYYVTASNSCNTDSDSVTVTVQLPLPVDLGNDTMLCTGNTLNLNAGAGYTSYLWQNGSGSQTFTVSSAGTYYVNAANACGNYSDSINVSYNNSAIVNLGSDQVICSGTNVVLNATGCTGCTYSWQDGSTGTTFTTAVGGTYYVTATDGCSIVTDSVIIVAQSPIQVDLGNDTMLCSGNTLNLNAGAGYNTYLWQDGSTSQTFILSVSGMYYVTAANACGNYSDSISVAFNASPSVSLGNDQILCAGTTITLSSAPCGSCNYSWQNGSGGTSFIASTAGLYYLTVTNACGSVADSVLLTAMNSPSITLRNDTSVCSGASVTLSAPSTFGYQYLWQNGSTSNTINVNSSGSYWLTATNFCGSDTDTFKLISVYPLPPIDLGNDTSLCAGETLTLNAFHPGYTYLWQNNTTTSQNTVAAAGTYWVQVQDQNNCRAGDTVDVGSTGDPVIDLGADQMICDGDEVVLQLPVNLYTYLWQDGSTNYYFVVADTGFYSVTATNRCGADSDSIHFRESDCICNVDVPTAFSPNGDGANDILYMRGHCVVNINLYIYDRWGQKVFESHDLANGWDGNFNGKKMDTAVFTYYLTAESSIDKDKKFNKKGNISLIR